MKILLMFFNERCYTYTLNGGYFEPLPIKRRRSLALNKFNAVIDFLSENYSDASVGLLYFEERYAPFAEIGESAFKNSMRLSFPPSARLAMNLSVTEEEDEYVAARLASPCSTSGSGSSSNNTNNNNGGSGSGSGGGCFGYGLDLI